MADELDNDIMRPPDSSEDELEDPKVSKENKPPVQKAPSPVKRKREAAKPTRTSKRKKLEDKPDLESPSKPDVAAPKTSQQTEFDVFSQQSQKRRPGYGGRSKIRLEDDIPMQLPRPTKVAALQTEDVGPLERSPPKRRTTIDTGEDVGLFDPQDPQKLPRLATLLDEGELSLNSSASTTKTLDDNLLATPEPEDRDPDQAPFSSPLTSPETAKDEDSPIICPVCRKQVPRDRIPSGTKDPRRLNLKDQRTFCRQHSTLDAQLIWEERGYPQINWDELESVRIPKLMPHLRRVLNQKTTSYYMTEVESHVNEAKGHRKKINNYLIEGAFELCKAGYYGPRGTATVMRVIEKKMSKDMADMHNDKLVRAIGQGHFVAAVLVPEVTVRLVMEDIHTKIEREARTVIDESTEAGLLLNPDDDHIDDIDLE